MKYLLIIAAIGLGLLSCKNNRSVDVKKAAVDSVNFTTVKWEDSIMNFGSIANGEKIQIKFRCLNTGDKPLIITNARPGCGCTVADYTKEPILPGKEGLVTASFNSTNFSGEVHKNIIVNTNTKNAPEAILLFTGTITGGVSNDKVVQPHPMPAKN
jgi:hypothetical protein